MHRITYPFWLIFLRDGGAVSLGGYAAAFSSAERGAAFMVGRRETRWEFRLVNRSALQALLPGLAEMGVRGVRLDPDEGGGVDVDFTQIIAPPTPLQPR